MGIFNEAVKDRQKQQKRIETKGTHTQQEKEKVERTIMSLSLTKADKLRLQQYALKKNRTVAGIVQDWIHEFCTED